MRLFCWIFRHKYIHSRDGLRLICLRCGYVTFSLNGFLQELWSKPLFKEAWMDMMFAPSPWTEAIRQKGKEK